MREVLNDEPGPARQIVLANAAAALFAAGEVDRLPHGVQRAEDALRSGKAAQILDRLIREPGTE